MSACDARRRRDCHACRCLRSALSAGAGGVPAGRRRHKRCAVPAPGWGRATRASRRRTTRTSRRTSRTRTTRTRTSRTRTSTEPEPAPPEPAPSRRTSTSRTRTTRTRTTRTRTSRRTSRARTSRTRTSRARASRARTSRARSQHEPEPAPAEPAPPEPAPQPAVAPGWYIDPAVPSQYRYWDGTAWSEHIHPLEQPAQPARDSGAHQQQPDVEPSAGGVEPDVEQPPEMIYPGRQNSDIDPATTYDRAVARAREGRTNPTGYGTGRRGQQERPAGNVLAVTAAKGRRRQVVAHVVDRSTDDVVGVEGMRRGRQHRATRPAGDDRQLVQIPSGAR